MRIFSIFFDRLKENSFIDNLLLLKNNLYFSEPIEVYKQSIQIANKITFTQESDIYIKKGNVSDLNERSKSISPVPWEFKCHIFDKIKDYFIAENKDGIQHISWIYYKSDHNRLLSLREKEAEIKFCLTLPALRGRGIYPQVVKSIIHYLAENGYENVYMCVHSDNKASIRGIEKAGFRHVGSLKLRKLLGMQISSRLDTAILD